MNEPNNPTRQHHSRPNASTEHAGVADPAMTDPVLARRAQIERLAKSAKRVGYAIIGIACIVFVIGFTTGFAGWMIPFTAWSFALSAAILCPAIIASYGVSAANKDEGIHSGKPSRH